MDDVREVAPGLLEFTAAFPPCNATKDGVRLKYIPVRVSAPDLPLEEMTDLQLRGRLEGMRAPPLHPAFLHESLAARVWKWLTTHSSA
jgi:hypothetical protein